MNRICLLCGAALAVAALSPGIGKGANIPYPNKGTYDSATYTFVATGGAISGYFYNTASAPTDAADEDTMAVWYTTMSGTTKSQFGLDNMHTADGSPFTFFNSMTAAPPPPAGTVVTLVLYNMKINPFNGGFSSTTYAYSNPALNGPFDSLYAPASGVNHVYVTPYDNSDSAINSMLAMNGNPPNPVFVGWEDLPDNGTDYDYNDLQVVLTGVQAVPEPASLTLLGIGISGLAGYGWRRRK